MARAPFEPGVCLVTGGGSGIGAALAAVLAARGGQVVVTDIDAESARATASRLGPTAFARQLDVADAAAVSRLVTEVADEFGSLDVMCNNAGIAVGGRHEELDGGAWERALEINLGGVINGVNAAYPIMQRQRRGRILNTASLAGLVPAPSMLPYTATKHAIVGRSTGLRAEAATFGIVVSVLCPGFTDTPLLDHVYRTREQSSQSVRRQVRLLQPRLLTAEKVAAAAVAGLDRNRGIIVVGALAQLLWRLNRLFPVAGQAVTRLAGTQRHLNGGSLTSP